MAIAAVDVALWDLKARLLGLPLCRLLGAVRDSVPIYGSGGFTTLLDRAPAEQLSGWVEQRDPAREDEGRLRARRATRSAYGARARGDRPGRRAVRRRERRVHAQAGARARGATSLSRRGVSWFEEPVSSDDLDGLRAGPRARSGRDGDRRRRVRLRPALFRAHARRRGGRRAAGRRDPLRRHHRAAARRRAVPRARAAAVAALRAGDPRARRDWRSRSSSTSSTSTITNGSSGCSSTACSSRATAHCGPTSTAPGMGLELKRARARRRSRA